MQPTSFRTAVASDIGEQIDRLFFAEVALTIFFSVIVVAMVTFLAVRYRRGNDVDRSNAPSHNTPLELFWSIIPLILALGIFFWSTKIFAVAYAPPKNAKEIFVIGKQWMWHLQHENGVRENNELHLAVGEPVKLTMISQDVIHAFYVPEFRIQRQVEPGQYTTMWFTPTRVGRYHLFCNMYCGTQHSEMGGWVYVMSKADFAKWQAMGGGAHPVATGGINTPTGGLTMAQDGAALFEQYQCASCHSQEAVARGRGPSLVAIYGKSQQMSDGRILKVDDGYLRNVQYYPNEYQMANWPQGMPSYKGVMTEEQVLSVNSYIKALGTKASLGNAGEGQNLQPRAQYGPVEGPAGSPDDNAPAANATSQQSRYMYEGEPNQ